MAEGTRAALSRHRLRLLGNHISTRDKRDQDNQQSVTFARGASAQLEPLTTEEFHVAIDALRKDLTLDTHHSRVFSETVPEDVGGLAEQLRMLNKEQRAMRRLLEQHVQDTKEVLQEQRRLAEAMDRFDYVPMSGRGTRSVRKPSSVRSTVRQLADRDLDVDTDTEPFLHVQLEDDLKHALLHRWEPAVRSLLDRGANPNMKFWDVISGGTHFSWCTPLAMAATLGNLGIARALLEFGAPASSQYSLVTGAGKIEHTFQAAFAALPGGDMRMLKLLVDAEADVCERSPTSNMSLIWRAADLG